MEPGRICGRELHALFLDAAYMVALQEFGLFPNTAAALSHLEDRLIESQQGYHPGPLDRLRDHLFAVRGPVPADAFTLVAAHTHWTHPLPIIIAAVEDHFIIGPQVPQADKLYRPVSFVFGEGRAWAYEWADETVCLPDLEYDACLKVIDRIAQNLAGEQANAGISLNFRFKKLFAPISRTAIENPLALSPAPFLEASIIEPLNIDLEASGRDAEAVGWYARSLLEYDLSPGERRLARMLSCRPDLLALFQSSAM